VPRLGQDACDHAVRFGLQLVLHLHRFHHHHTLTSPHLVTDAHLVAHDHARHRSADRLRPRCRTGTPGHRTDGARALVDDLGTHRPAVHVHGPGVLIALRDHRHRAAFEQQVLHLRSRQRHEVGRAYNHAIDGDTVALELDDNGAGSDRHVVEHASSTTDST
jgi:hypothetical protein